MSRHTTRTIASASVFLAATLWGAASHAATERPCAGASAPAVQVVPRLGTPKFNRTPREQLTLAATVTRPGEADGMLDFRVAVDLSLEPSSTRAGCPVRSVQALIQPTLLELYIAKEVEPGSCRFRAVYEHELKHVMLAQKAIDRSAAALRKKLLATLTALPADQLRDMGAVRAKLDEVVNEQLEELHEQYAQDNEALDTHEEGERMAKQCAEPQAFVGDRLLTADEPLRPKALSR